MRILQPGNFSYDKHSDSSSNYFCIYRAQRTLNVESDAIAKMTEMRDRGALAFVGSGFSCKSEALVADAWNLPMIAFVRGHNI